MRVMRVMRHMFPTTCEKCQRQNIYIGLNMPAITRITRTSLPALHGLLSAACRLPAPHPRTSVRLSPVPWLAPAWRHPLPLALTCVAPATIIAAVDRVASRPACRSTVAWAASRPACRYGRRLACLAPLPAWAFAPLPGASNGEPKVTGPSGAFRNTVPKASGER